MPRGRFRHDSIAAAPAVRGERLIGWSAHYLIGIAFAAMLPGIWGLAWIQHPTIGPALIVGIGTVAAPFLVMQPGMGAGIAASRTPNPAAARLQASSRTRSSASGSMWPPGLPGSGTRREGGFHNNGYLIDNYQQENEMRIPARFAPILFGALLSAIMVAIVSAFVLATAQGIRAGPGAMASCGHGPRTPTVLHCTPWLQT